MPFIYQPKKESKLSITPSFTDSSHIINSYAGEWTSIGENNNESTFGDYTYTMENVTVNYAEIGKFCSIASHVCINPVQHPMDRVSQHHMTYRKVAYDFAGEDDEGLFNWRRTQTVKIGHDVWNRPWCDYYERPRDWYWSSRWVWGCSEKTLSLIRSSLVFLLGQLKEGFQKK